MIAWAKYTVVLLVATFAVASTMQIAQATKMDIQMSVPMEAGGDCPDCPRGPGGNGVLCTLDCVVSFTALLASDPAGVSPADHGSTLMPWQKSNLTGWRAPPDPYPPKHVS